MSAATDHLPAGRDSQLSQQTWLIACLGNPGKEYVKTRHNLGFMVGDALAAKLNLSFSEEKRVALTAKGKIEGALLHIVLPLTYMNLSGSAIVRYLNYYKIPPARLLVVFDDVDLPFGQIKLKAQGSSGGHNGLKSIEQALGSSYYPRLKLGIGLSAKGEEKVKAVPRPSPDRLADYVLAPFTREEELSLPSLINRGADSVLTVVQLGVQRAMSEMNRMNRINRTNEV